MQIEEEYNSSQFREVVLERTFYLASGCFFIGNRVLVAMDLPLPAISHYLAFSLAGISVVFGQALRRKLISFKASAYILLLLVAITVFLLSMLSSGFQGPINSILLLLPAYAALFLGIRGCIAMSLICTALLITGYVLNAFGYVPYNAYPAHQAMAAKLVIFIFAVAAVVVASSAYELSRRRTEKAMAALNQKLELAHKEAAHSLQVKSQFLANISHEVRTPLNGILGMVTMLREKIDDDSVVQQLKTIEFSGESLLAMLNDVLDASKLESGKLELESTPFRLTEQVQNVGEVFSLLAQQQGIELKVTVTDGVPELIEGDSVRLSQVLINLVSNAIKFSDEKDVELRLSAEHLSGDNYSIQVDVVDQGIGISKESIKKLFQPFSQANSSTTREFGGSGLGLSICKGIIDQMGGKIWVESEEWIGSTFSISFPARKVDPGVLVDSETPQLRLMGEREKFLPLDILVAEDNLVNRQVVEAYLSRLGYKADYVENGVRAIESAMAHSYDLILMDCQMPVLDGFAATREIVRQLGEDRPRIVALTAISQKTDLDLCLDAGMDEMISKPLRLERLEALLLDVCLNKQQHTLAEAAPEVTA